MTMGKITGQSIPTNKDIAITTTVLAIKTRAFIQLQTRARDNLELGLVLGSGANNV
jgi:hypothetical protein